MTFITADIRVGFYELLILLYGLKYLFPGTVSITLFIRLGAVFHTRTTSWHSSRIIMLKTETK